MRFVIGFLYLIVVLLIFWGPFALAWWLFTDMPIWFALLMGALSGSFFWGLLDGLWWLKKRLGKKSKKKL